VNTKTRTLALAAAALIAGAVMGYGAARRPATPPDQAAAALAALDGRLAEEREALHDFARRAHLAGSPEAAAELDGALKRCYERHKARVRAACREAGRPLPSWAE
jgi:MoxR-like ATPase